MRLIRVATFACVMLFVLAAADENKPIRLLEVGEWHGEELTVGQSPNWYGLAHAGNGFAWHRYTPSFPAVEDPVIDEPGEKTGKAVVVRGQKPVFLVQGDTPFTSTRVLTSFYRADGLQLAYEPLGLLKLRNKSYRLRLDYVRRQTTDLAQPSALLLERAGTKQVLYQWPAGFSDEHCELIWAGDLDGDGKLDLYMYLGEHYNVTVRTLFLSSAARLNELVGRVAVWRTTGC